MTLVQTPTEVACFRLVVPSGEVRLCSRAAVPQELGIARAPRQLGVAVRRLVLKQGNRHRVVVADSVSLLDGYHDFEPDNGMRWTCGDAAKPAELFSGIRGPAMLLVELGGSTQYVDDDLACRFGPGCVKKPRPVRGLYTAGAGGGRWGPFPSAPKAVVPPNLANLPKQAFRSMVSADLDNPGGHHTSTRVLRRHEHVDP